MKGLILAGGTGSRMQPIKGPKQLVPINGKPVIFYAIQSLLRAGIYNIGVVVNSTEIQKAIGNKFRANFTYIWQDEPLGLAHAVKISEDFIKKDEFIMILGDNIIEDRLLYLAVNKGTSLMFKKVDNPRAFGVPEFSVDKLVNLEEKPANPKSNYALVGAYKFTPDIFMAIDSLSPSLRGELEITDAINWLLRYRFPVSYEITTKYWVDVGKPSSITEATKAMSSL